MKIALGIVGAYLAIGVGAMLYTKQDARVIVAWPLLLIPTK